MFYLTSLKLFQPLKLFEKNFRRLLQLMNIFQHVQCRWNYFEIISHVVTCEAKLFQRFISHPTVVTCETKRWNYFKIILFHMYPWLLTKKFTNYRNCAHHRTTTTIFLWFILTFQHADRHSMKHHCILIIKTQLHVQSNFWTRCNLQIITGLKARSLDPSAVTHHQNLPWQLLHSNYILI